MQMEIVLMLSPYGYFFHVDPFLAGPGLKPPLENTLQYLEEIAIQTAKCVANLTCLRLNKKKKFNDRDEWAKKEARFLNLEDSLQVALQERTKVTYLHGLNTGKSWHISFSKFD